jgi:hypothetical protein
VWLVDLTGSQKADCWKHNGEKFYNFKLHLSRGVMLQAVTAQFQLETPKWMYLISMRCIIRYQKASKTVRNFLLQLARRHMEIFCFEAVKWPHIPTEQYAYTYNFLLISSANRKSKKEAKQTHNSKEEIHHHHNRSV